jgi:CAAX prenyl protease-like protein
MAEGSTGGKGGPAVPRPAATDSLQAPTWTHILPFVLWLFVMQMLGDPAGWKYAVRSAAGVAALLYWRPWRWYAPFSPRHLPLAGAVGLVGFGMWVVFETEWMGRWPEVQSVYFHWGVMPLGRLPASSAFSAYAPDASGWPLTLIRIAGSGLVISLIEEFFWRGFVYRWVIDQNWLDVDIGSFHPGPYVLVALFFGFEHQRWLTGFLCGLAYGWLTIRTRDIWAAGVAHAVTNLLLGVYVVAAGQYQFWS